MQKRYANVHFNTHTHSATIEPKCQFRTRQLQQVSQRTLTMFVGVVALRYQQVGVDNEVPQLPQT